MEIKLFTNKYPEETNKNKTSKFVQVIKYTSLTLLSSYLFIKFLGFLRKKNPTIFIIKKNIGGTIGNYYKGGFEKKMNRREACLILGVTDNITRKELKETHKKLMMLNHPDSGGSTYLASKINQAKDLLMQNVKDYKH